MFVFALALGLGLGLPGKVLWFHSFPSICPNVLGLVFRVRVLHGIHLFTNVRWSNGELEITSFCYLNVFPRFILVIKFVSGTFTPSYELFTFLSKICGPPALLERTYDFTQETAPSILLTLGMKLGIQKYWNVYETDIWEKNPLPHLDPKRGNYITFLYYGKRLNQLEWRWWREWIEQFLLYIHPSI